MTSPDLLGDDSLPGPTMVNLPPPPENNDGASFSAGSSTNSTMNGGSENSNNSNNNNRWESMMGAMAGSFVNSARGVMNTATTSVSSQSNTTHSSTTSTTSNIKQQQLSGSVKKSSPPTSGGGNAFLSNLTSSVSSATTNISTSVTSATNNISTSTTGVFQPLTSFTKSITHNITGKNTLPDKTTASQVLMFRQLLHTKCRPGLRLSRNYEGTAAQKAVLHMPWWERGIESTKKMIISYDNLITRLWLSGAIMPFEKGGYGCSPIVDGTSQNNIMDGGSLGGQQQQQQQQGGGSSTGAIDTLINEKGLPPIPHLYWVDRLGFQQDDPVTDFRSGGVLSLAMLVHIVESCPMVHSRFVPKPKADTSATSSYISSDIISLEEIITDDASVLPFGITCINITDMLAKFLLFSKAVDKMDALLSAKPFWKMFIDPNAMLVLQEVSLDLLCDICVEIGRERRIDKIHQQQQQSGGGSGSEDDNNNKASKTKKKKKGSGMPGMEGGKVTVFDFSEIMERTEKRVGDEVLGAGPQNVDELRAVARRVKSKYLMRIQLKEKHSINQYTAATAPSMSKQIPPLPSKESVKNVTNSVIGGVGAGVGGFVSLLKRGDSAASASAKEGPSESSSNVINFSSSPVDDTNTINNDAVGTLGGQEVEVHIDGTTSSPSEAKSSVNPFSSSTTTATTNDTAEATTKSGIAQPDEGLDELDKLSAELDNFDLLGGDDFDMTDIGDHSEELLDMMDEKVDPMAVFGIGDDEDFMS